MAFLPRKNPIHVLGEIAWANFECVPDAPVRAREPGGGSKGGNKPFKSWKRQRKGYGGFNHGEYL